MKAVAHVIAISALALILLTQTGCFSYAAYQHNKKNAQVRKARLMGNEAAIKAFSNGDTVGIGIDISNWEVLKEGPLLQAAGALADAAAAYTVKEGLDGFTQHQIIIVNNSGNGTVNITVSHTSY